MSQISIVLGTHKEQPIIKILFDYDNALVARIKNTLKLFGVKVCNAGTYKIPRLIESNLT
jgi:hypothetical protein